MIQNKFNQIYFNGCSFTEGGGFEAKKEHEKHIKNNMGLSMNLK
jgi:hypothetical protein